MPFYSAKLAFFLRSLSLITLISFVFQKAINAQECIDLEGFEDEETGTMNWQQFPNFTLPFELVYGLPIRNQDANQALNHGFSLISDPSAYQSIGLNQTAQIYYGPAYLNQNQPWETLRSPWENNAVGYAQKWNSDYLNFAQQTTGDGLINSSLFCFDIERVYRFDHEILALKNNPAIPGFYTNRSDEEFLQIYKRDIRGLYASVLSSYRSNGISSNTRIASYSDTPIVNTFENIQGRTWEQWQTDKSALNFICTDENGDLGGSFYDQIDIATPAAYYYYDYPHPFAGEYLSYLLFQIEANKAWTDKPVIPFVWMRYSFNEDVVDQYIKPWMAEATAIFPFFSGAEGLWLWENPILHQTENEFAIYNHFLKGLYRLSEVKDFFEGDHELVMETSARDYNENKQPIWRGVVKGDQMLVAAHNPFASDENEEVTIGISYQNWSGTVTLKGYETKLCVYDLSALGMDENQLQIEVYPNPANDILKVALKESIDNLEINLYNLQGQLLHSKEITNTTSNEEISLNINHLPQQEMIVEIKEEHRRFVKKLIKIE
ncbi:T9SS type A sorting domain-containing protein [Jiulongibacter sp. NS-SX5]|uniref:T9SS type A sorting domain-containing protein n=1 Tax=Jiulongibacter sp. NS-SX5 TaxID=3463854 RepID=UPI004058C391